MKVQKIICTGLALLGTTTLGGLPTIALGAENVANASGLEEIVVTSRKRQEKLQDIPDSIAVLTAAQLEASNVQNLRGFVQLTPNLLVRETFRTNETFLTMRGISSAQGALPPVAFVVDGVQLGSNDFINQDLLEIERIEVLRGPQGALYGQGAIAGAINIVTKQPTNDLSVYAKASYGRANTARFAGSISGPLVKDKLFGRVSGFYKRSDGLIYNKTLDTTVDGYHQGSGRAQLDYVAERFRAHLRGSYTKGKSYCCIQDKSPIDSKGNYINVDDVTNPGADSNTLGLSWDKYADASLKMDYDFDPVTVTSISGYAYVRQHIYGDADYSAAPAVTQNIFYTTKVYNQELRLTSRKEGPLQWLFGGFYQKRFERQNVMVGSDPGTEVRDEPSADFLPGNVLHIDTYNNSHSWALFGSANYDITRNLQLTLAGRYDHDSQNFLDHRLLIPNPNLQPARATFTKFQPKVQLAYHWTPDFMVYTSYAEGFRSGGYSQDTAFANETTKNYELGFKSTLLDGLLTLNGAVFHIDYRNQQISFVFFAEDPITHLFVAKKGVVNIPKSRVDGMELELTAKPTDKLLLSAGLGVADAVALELTPNALVTQQAVNALIGNKSPLVPAFTFNLSGTYTQPVSSNLDLVLHADYRREGGYYHDLGNLIKTGAHDYINGKISLQSAGGWEIGAYGNNLTNERSAVYVSATGSRLRFPNQPRSYGVEASFKF